MRPVPDEKYEIKVLCDCQDPEKDIKVEGGCMTPCKKAECNCDWDWECPVCGRIIRVIVNEKVSE